MTVTVYSVECVSSAVTVIVSTFSPVSHVALPPLVTSVSPSMITTSAPVAVGVAVTLFASSVVVAVYSTVSLSNVGSSVTDAISSPDSVVTSFL